MQDCSIKRDREREVDKEFHKLYLPKVVSDFVPVPKYDDTAGGQPEVVFDIVLPLHTEYNIYELWPVNFQQFNLNSVYIQSSP